MLAAEFGYEIKVADPIETYLDLEDKLCESASYCVAFIIVVE